MYINMYIMSIHATNLLKSILELMMIKILCLTTFLASSQQVQNLLECLDLRISKGISHF